MIRIRNGLASLVAAPLLVGLAFGLGACGGSGDGDTDGENGSAGGGAEGGTVRVAVCGPMTGSAAAFGEMIKNAAKLMEKEVNAAGGVDVGGTKMKLEAVVFDDKGDTTEATNVARKVASDDSLLFVIGHFNSTCSNAAKGEYNRVGIVQFSPGSTNVKVCKDGPFTFRNLYRDDYQGQQIAAYVKETLGVSKVAVIYDNDDYGKGLMQSFKAQAEKEGLAVVAEEGYLRERTQDFKPLVQKAKDAGADGIFIAGLYNEAALITKAARQDLQLDVPIMGGDGVMSPTFIKNAGAAAEGAYIATPFLFNTGNDSSAATAFMKAFEDAYGKEPDTWAALTYDALGMALATLADAGTDRDKVRAALAAATDEASGYTGVTGVTYFDAEGDCYSKPVYVATVKDGAFVPAEKSITK